MCSNLISIIFSQTTSAFFSLFFLGVYVNVPSLYSLIAVLNQHVSSSFDTQSYIPSQASIMYSTLLKLTDFISGLGITNCS